MEVNLTVCGRETWQEKRKAEKRAIGTGEGQGGGGTNRASQFLANWLLVAVVTGDFSDR